MNARLKYVIEMVIVIYAIGILMPDAITNIVGANTTGWSTGIGTIFTILLPMLIIFSLAIMLMPAELKSKVGLWAKPYGNSIKLASNQFFKRVRATRKHILALNHFER